MNATLYQSIVCQLAEAYTIYTDSVNSLTDMENVLSLTDVADNQKVALREDLEYCRQVLASDASSFQKQIIAVVLAMNTNVLRDNPNVNAFLIANNVQIPLTISNILNNIFTFDPSIVVSDETACDSF